MKTKRLVLVLLGIGSMLVPSLSQAGTGTTRVTSSTSVTQTRTYYYGVRYQEAPQYYTGHYGLVNYPWGAVIYYPKTSVNKGFKAY